MKCKLFLKYIIVSLILGSNSWSIHAQLPTAEATLAKVETYYKALETFHFDMVYNMYRGYSGENLTESYSGTVSKQGGVSQIQILGSEIIQFSNKQIVLNKADKTLTLRNVNAEAMQQSPMDISKFLKFYKASNTKVSGNYLVHEMVLKNSNIPMPYSKIVVYVNKTNYSLEKQILYMATKMPFTDANGKQTPDAGRLEVTFKQNVSGNKPTPKLSDYLRCEPEDTCRLANNYKTYTLIDQTNL